MVFRSGSSPLCGHGPDRAHFASWRTPSLSWVPFGKRPHPSPAWSRQALSLLIGSTQALNPPATSQGVQRSSRRSFALRRARAPLEQQKRRNSNEKDPGPYDDRKIRGPKTKKPRAGSALGLHVFMCMRRRPHVHFVVLMLVGRRSFSYRCSRDILCYCH